MIDINPIYIATALHSYDTIITLLEVVCQVTYLKNIENSFFGADIMVKC